jgi:SpoVK/Ycf46/Vps4 family AAA+-type ATPase
MDDLAERVESRAGWDDLVLPPAQKRTLRTIAAHLRQRARVQEEWGFGAAPGGRGLGLAALFSGPSGAGKTMAAEVLGGALGLDVYRVDLSALVSKWIGETEKNLRRVFDAAEEGSVILLFDEADSLFGKRSEVRDSHDRYANMEISYLLQRLEAYRGLAILTTNLRNNVDEAFLRRFRFVVDFTFPGVAERAEIWSRAFPRDCPTEGLEVARLAQLNVVGGAIRNIAMNAAYIAAEAARPVGMRDVLAAARLEYEKAGRAMTDPELRGWPQ